MSASSHPTEVGDASASDSGLRSPDEPAPLVLAPGDRVGRYVVLQLVGSGGMGVVHAAHDPELDRRVALKLLHPRRATQSSKGHARLLREAQAMARLRHPNVIAVHHVGTVSGGYVYVAMELVDGETLADWLRRTKPDHRAVLAVFLEAARGLAAAHAAGLVHRDFKPENVLVGRDGRVVVTDFGLARDATSPSSSDRHDTEASAAMLDRTRIAKLTRTEAGAGTLAYMAPEQHLRGDIDGRADQFAFAVALYDALWHQHPFGTDSPQSTIGAVTRGEIREPPPRSHVPSWLRDPIVRALQPNPVDRWPTMDALIEALEAGPSRRARWIAASTTGVAALGLAALFANSSGVKTACSDASDEIADTWNPTRAANVKAALLATEMAYAPETATNVARLLDGYAGAWTAAWADACESSEPADREIRSTCLTGRKAAMQAVLEVLEVADAQVLERAIELVRSLPPIERCSGDNRAGAGPPDAETARGVAEVGKAIAMVRALLEAGQTDAALARADGAVAEAGQTQWPPAIGDALLARAAVRERTGDFAAAAADGETVYYGAEATGDATLAAGAAILLVRLYGLRLGDPDRAESWIPHARSWIARAGDDGEGSAKLSFAIGFARYAQGRFDEASTELRNALAFNEQRHGADDYRNAQYLTALGAVQYELGRYDEALASQHRALGIVEGQLGSMHPAVADALTNVGALSNTLGRTDEGLAALERGLEIREAQGDPNHPSIALLLNNIAGVYAGTARCADALPRFARARTILEARLGAEHPDVVTIVANEGNCFVATGRRTEGIAALRRALEIRERILGADHPDVADNRRELALALREQGELGEARRQIELALEVVDRMQGPEHPRIAHYLTELAKIDLAAGRPQEAMESLRRALPISERIFGRDHEEPTELRRLLAQAQR